MNDPDYKIRFNPVNRPKGFGFDVEVSDEFVEFARRQEINKKSYEDAAENALKLDGEELQGRRMFVKIAHQEETQQDEFVNEHHDS